MSRQPRKKAKIDESSSSSSQSKEAESSVLLDDHERQRLLKHLLGKSDEVEASRDSLLSWFSQPSYLGDVGPENSGDHEQVVNAYSEGYDQEYTKFFLQKYADDDAIKSSIVYQLRYAQVRGMDKLPLAPARDRLVAVAVPFPAQPAENHNRESEKAMGCFLCLHIMKNPCVLICGHSACLKCLQDYFKGVSKKCPKCQRFIPRDQVNRLAPSVALRDAISLIFPHIARENDMEELLNTWKKNFQLWCMGVPTRTPLEIRHLVRTNFFDFPKGGDNGDNIVHTVLSDFSLRRICRRAGILFEDQSRVYDEIRKAGNCFITVIKKRLQCLTTDTVTVDDVVKAPGDISTRPEMNHCKVYGFGGPHHTRHLFSSCVVDTLARRHPGFTIDPTALSVMNDLLADIMFSIHERAAHNAVEGSADGAIVEFPAGPIEGVDEEGETEIATSHSISLYVNKDECARRNTRPNMKAPVPLIDVSVLEATLPVLFFVGDKLVGSVKNTYEVLVRSMEDIGMGAFTVRPEHVIRMINTSVRFQTTYSIKATIYLTATLQCVCDEILCMAGCVAETHSTRELTSRHILSAIRMNKELSALFSGAMKEAGSKSKSGVKARKVFRDITIGDNNEAEGKAEGDDDDEHDVALTRPLVEKACASVLMEGEHHVLLAIDPKTGLHFCCDVDLYLRAKFDGHINNFCPIADAMCSVKCSDRKKEATKALQAIRGLNNEGKSLNPSVSSRSLDLTAESLKRAWRARLCEIEFEYRCTEMFLPPVGFARLVMDCVQVQWPYAIKKWTREVLAALQTVFEYHLVTVCERANSYAVHADRFVVLEKDLQIARKIIE